jgi:hypothetical protein
MEQFKTARAQQFNAVDKGLQQQVTDFYRRKRATKEFDNALQKTSFCRLTRVVSYGLWATRWLPKNFSLDALRHKPSH